MYGRSEYIKMLKHYYENDENAKAAREAYQWEFMDKLERDVISELPRIPSVPTILQVVRRFNETGSVDVVREVARDRPVRTVALEERVLEIFRRTPGTSIRKVALRLGVSKTLVHRILKDNYLDTCHISIVRKLKPGDTGRRLEFSHFYQNRSLDNPIFWRTILWSDECFFTEEGYYDVHNMHEWRERNSSMETNHQDRFSVHLWAGLLNGRIIGPYFFDEAATGVHYLEMLQQHLPLMLNPRGLPDDELPIVERNIIFQHDGAGEHYQACVGNYLNKTYPNKWIGRGGPIAWPSRSPDLTPLGFFLWDHVKEQVYKSKVNSAVELRQRIQDAMNNIPRVVILKAMEAVTKRTQMCINLEGGHFERISKK